MNKLLLQIPKVLVRQSKSSLQAMALMSIAKYPCYSTDASHSTIVAEAPLSTETEERKVLDVSHISNKRFDPSIVSLLTAPIAESDIDIRPDGLLYMPEIKYRKLLNNAFGPGAWVLVPMGSFIRSGNSVVQSYALYINGNFVAQAYGEHTLYSEDQLGTALEATKSSALVRCCKDLGVASELWDSKFVEDWKNKNAIAVWVEHQVKKGLKKKLFRKKDDSPFGFPYKETSADSIKSEKTSANTLSQESAFGLPSDMALPSLQDMPSLDAPLSEEVEAPEELVQSVDEEATSAPKPKSTFKKYTSSSSTPKESTKQPSSSTQEESEEAFMFNYLESDNKPKASFLDLKSKVGFGKFKDMTWGEFIKQKTAKGYCEWALGQNWKPETTKKFETALKMITKK